MRSIRASRPEPGAAPTDTRALAPDLARGGMLALIALANVRVYLHGHSLSVRGYPQDVEGVNRVVAALELMLIDGRAYGACSTSRTSTGGSWPERRWPGPSPRSSAVCRSH